MHAIGEVNDPSWSEVVEKCIEFIDTGMHYDSLHHNTSDTVKERVVTTFLRIAFKRTTDECRQQANELIACQNYDIQVIHSLVVCIRLSFV